MSLIAARVIRALETHLRPAYLNLP
jgi:hypothetical protein